MTRTRGQTRRPAQQQQQRRPAETIPRQAPLRTSPIRVAPAAPAASLAPATFSDDQSTLQEDDQLFREQAQNAHYTFASAVDDKLTDNSQVP